MTDNKAQIPGILMHTGTIYQCCVIYCLRWAGSRQDGTTGKDSNIILKGGCKNISDSVPLRFPWSATGGGWHGSRRNPCEQESGT